MKFISLRYTSILVLLCVFIPVSLVAGYSISNQHQQQLSQSREIIKNSTNTAFDEQIFQSFIQLEILAEEVIYLHRLNHHYLSNSQIADSLNETFQWMQLNHGIQVMQLISPDGTIFSQGEVKFDDSPANFAKLQHTQVPVHDIECQTECFLNVMVPIRFESSTWGLTLSAELTELIVAFTRLRNIDAGLIMELESDRFKRHWHGRELPILTNSDAMMEVLKLATDPQKILQGSGATVSMADKSYYIWSHRYQSVEEHDVQVLFFHDMTAASRYITESQNSQTIVVIVLFSSLFIAILVFSSFPLRRLKQITTSVKHLGEKDYQTAIDSLKHGQRPRVTDEIGLVNNSILLASGELKIYESQLRQSQQHLEYVATYDTVTNRLNRYAFTTRFSELRSNQEQQSVALILIDIDDFSSMNDNLGHQIGDMILQSAGTRLQQLTNENVDLYRYGGDEFMLLCVDPKDAYNIVQNCLNKLSTLFAAPIDIMNTSLSVRVSCGVALCSTEDTLTERLPTQAVLALQEAKRNNINTFAYFNPEMESRANLIYRIKTDFALALANNEFSVNYQPMISLQGASLVKMEALIRWHHSELGQIFPDQFIPVLEETGQIEPLTFWLIEQTAKQVTQLDNIGLVDVKISVNISGHQVSDLSFISKIRHIITQHQVSPDRFELEITETALVKDFNKAQEWVEHAKRAGFGVAMDDFGTGYASISYLTSIDFDTVKLDRTLINNLTSDKIQQNVVRSISNMIKDLGRKIVVEGIEEYNQFTFLRELGCHTGQGYLIAKPLNSETLKSELQQYTRKQNWFDTIDSN